jgi:hypothetical protein
MLDITAVDTSVSKLIEGYLVLKDRIATIESEAMLTLQAKVMPLKIHLETIENAITAELLRLGPDEGKRNIKTPAGTAYREHWDSFTVENREQWIDFIINTESVEMITNHVSKEALRDHMDEHNSQCPPGIGYSHGYKTRVRRAR